MYRKNGCLLGAMLRRKPTRIELNLDDIPEWHAATKEWEKTKKVPDVAALSTVASDVGPSKQNRRELIQQRIGYDPRPVRQSYQQSFD